MKTLRDLAIQLFRKEPPPSARLSFLVGVGQRQVQYWLSGRDPTPADVIETVEDQIKAVDDFKLQERIDALVDEAEKAGVRDQIIVHYFDQAVERLKDRSNNP